MILWLFMVKNIISVRRAEKMFDGQRMLLTALALTKLCDKQQVIVHHGPAPSFDSGTRHIPDTPYDLRISKSPILTRLSIELPMLATTAYVYAHVHRRRCYAQIPL
jgi:hypothetical protein